MIEMRGVERYAHVVINGRGNIARGDRPLLDRAAVAFGRANDLPVTEAAARHHHRHHDGPMVAPVGAVLRADLRCPAKFPITSTICFGRSAKPRTTLKKPSGWLNGRRR